MKGRDRGYPCKLVVQGKTTKRLALKCIFDIVEKLLQECWAWMY